MKRANSNETSNETSIELTMNELDEVAAGGLSEAAAAVCCAYYGVKHVVLVAWNSLTR